MKNLSMSNCTVDDDLAPWIVAGVTNLGIISILGGIGNSCCVWCLFQDRRIKPAIRFQLVCLFSLMTIYSVITQPSATFTFYNNTFCVANTSPVINFLSTASNSFVLQMERSSIALVAVLRMVAVCWPQRHKEWCRLRVVMALQAGIVLYILPIWIIYGAVMDFQLFPADGSLMHMTATRAGYGLNIIIFVMYYAVPFLITLIASVAMLIRLRQQKQAMDCANVPYVDHVVRSITLVILANLVMDFPHLVVHLFPQYKILSIIIHMVFFYHLAIDPTIFLASNPNHRRAMLKLLHRGLPQVCRWVLPQLSNSSVVKSDCNDIQDTHKNTTTAE